MFRYYRLLFAVCLISSAFIQPARADHGSLNFGSGNAGPIITTTAATLPAGKLAVSLTGEYLKSDPFPDAALAEKASHHIHAHSTDWMLTTSAGISYGLRDDLSLSLRIPHVHRENIRASSHVHGAGGVVNSAEDLGDVSGIGDIGVLGKCRFWHDAVFQAALMAGVKAPTGWTKMRHDGERLEAEHQPGSGSWDGMAGLAAGTKAGPVALDASALYTLVTEGAQHTDLGDRVNYNLAASYRIHGTHYHQTKAGPRAGAFDLVLELNGEWAAQQKEDGERDENSGGTTVYLSPGVRWAPDDKWSGHVSVGVPVVSNLGDGHAETDYRVTVGIGRAF